MLVYGKHECFSSCRCCMFVSCVHPVAVRNAAFCMTCNLLMVVEDARRGILQSRCHDCLICVYVFLEFGDRDYVSQLPYVRYYVVVKGSFKHTCEECESKMAYVF